MNRNWNREELILALDLFFRHNPSHISKSHPEVIRLSNLLNRMASGIYEKDEKFRNPNGVYMKLQNFQSINPNYAAKGLSRGNRLEKVLWDEFAERPEELGRIAKSIEDSVDAFNPKDILDGDTDDFPEGRILYSVHRRRERNNALVRRKKAEAVLAISLSCEICGFDFRETYGEIGRGFIECHHMLPISEMIEGSKTRLEDLILVCSNCHRMLHRKRPWVTADELRSFTK